MEHLEKLINEKFETVNVKLDATNAHLKKLNGTVARHEKVINDALIERAQRNQLQDDKYEEIDAIDTRLGLVEKAEVNHFTNCPQAPLVRKLQDEALTNRSMKKYQGKLFAISTTVLGLLIAGLGLWIKLGGQ